ncbi:hypothetical protein C1645_735796 [Glomus cerebriforme]|uniref:Uncharacterized protein n=1 Tax=Glomus cerebriforme TaxID=658196 RepID=A0A397TDX1_9GLOM|nr:hypothetical protein C1645_735796 [Glomus cerebriforme]
MPNTHSIDSLRELNTKLLAEIAKLRKKNAEIPDLKRKLAKFESKKVELKVRLAKALRQTIEENKKHNAENVKLKIRIKKLEKNKTDFSAKNVRYDDTIAKLKAKVVKLRNNNGRSNQVTFLLSCVSDQKSSENRIMNTFLNDIYKKNVNNGISITNKTSCPLCKLDYNDEESIESRYKASSYFIKCE